MVSPSESRSESQEPVFAMLLALSPHEWAILSRRRFLLRAQAVTFRLPDTHCSRRLAALRLYTQCPTP